MVMLCATTCGIFFHAVDGKGISKESSLLSGL
jgi:hypothetical protein